MHQVLCNANASPPLPFCMQNHTFQLFVQLSNQFHEKASTRSLEIPPFIPSGVCHDCLLLSDFTAPSFFFVIVAENDNDIAARCVKCLATEGKVGFGIDAEGASQRGRGRRHGIKPPYVAVGQRGAKRDKLVTYFRFYLLCHSCQTNMTQHGGSRLFVRGILQMCS